MKKTLKHLFFHFLLVLPLTVFFPQEKLILILSVIILGGYFPDIDHFIDYFIFVKKLKFDLAEFLKADYFAVKGKVYVFLHSWEIIFLLWLYFALVRFSLFGLAFTSAYTIHIFFDQFSYPIYRFGYFLSYRVIYKFEKKRICLDQ